MRILPGLIVFVLAVLLLGTPCLAAQTSAEGLVLPDSLSLATADSLQTATTPIDSLFYTAGRIYYDYQKNLIRLYDQPVVNYQDSEIQADSLYVDLDKERAYSFGPTRMRDADQLLLGSDARYDVNTQTGLFVNGFSMVEKGYYGGKELRKTG